MELIVFCGLQGAGKSSFYSKHFAETHLRVNLDMLRTRRREAAIFDACLSVGQRLVVDNTNVSREERQRYLKPGAEAHFRLIAYFFDIPFETCAERTSNAPVALGSRRPDCTQCGRNWNRHHSRRDLPKSSRLMRTGSRKPFWKDSHEIR